MTREQQFESAINDLTLSDIQQSGLSALKNWLIAWGQYIAEITNLQPPHKPPF